MASVCLSLLLWPAAVLPSARVVGRRRLALSTAAALSAATLRPRRAAADRGKDLYTSDGALLQSDGGVVQDALLPQFDSSGALIVGNGYSEETAYRTVRSGPASVEVLKGWVSTDAGGLRDPVTDATTLNDSLDALLEQQDSDVARLQVELVAQHERRAEEHAVLAQYAKSELNAKKAYNGTRLSDRSAPWPSTST